MLACKNEVISIYTHIIHGLNAMILCIYVHIHSYIPHIHEEPCLLTYLALSPDHGAAGAAHAGPSICTLGPQQLLLLLLLAGVVRSSEDLPEAEGLISCSRCYGVAVRALGHVQDPGGVAPQLCHLRHGGVLPQAQLVLAEAMGAHQLLLVPAPLEGADLRAGVHAVEAGARLRVPELDAPVCGASARGKKVALEGAPCQGLHSSSVIVQAVQVRSRSAAGHHLGIPEMEQVIVSSARKLLP